MVDLNKIIIVLVAILLIVSLAVNVLAEDPIGKDPIGKPPLEAKQIKVSNYMISAYKVAPTKIVLETKKGDPLICEDCIEFELTGKAEQYLKAVKIYDGDKIYTWIVTKIKYEAITK